MTDYIVDISESQSRMSLPQTGFSVTHIQYLRWMEDMQCPYDHLPCPGNSYPGSEGADGLWQQTHCGHVQVCIMHQHECIT